MRRNTTVVKNSGPDRRHGPGNQILNFIRGKESHHPLPGKERGLSHAPFPLLFFSLPQPYRLLCTGYLRPFQSLSPRHDKDKNKKPSVHSQSPSILLPIRRCSEPNQNFQESISPSRHDKTTKKARKTKIKRFIQDF
jgi:hypothetical protein